MATNSLIQRNNFTQVLAASHPFAGKREGMGGARLMGTSNVRAKIASLYTQEQMKFPE